MVRNMTEIKTGYANRIIGIITLVVMISAAACIFIVINAGGEVRKSSSDVSTVASVGVENSQGENMIATGLHNLLVGSFKRDSEGRIIYPDEFCGDYVAEDGLHVVLKSIDGDITSEYNEYFTGYLDKVYYEQGKISYSDMQRYSSRICELCRKEGYSSCNAKIDISKRKIILYVQPQSVDNLKKFVDQLVGIGEFEELESSDVAVMELK